MSEATTIIQSLVDLVSKFLIVAFPISLVLCLSAKLVNFVTGFILGSREVRL